MVNGWDDDVRTELKGRLGDHSVEVADRWVAGLPGRYRDDVAPHVAADDLASVEHGAADLLVRFVPAPDTPDRDRLRVLRQGAEIELSEFLPLLESLGLWVVDEQHWVLADGWWVHDLGVRDVRGGPVDIEREGARLASAVLSLWHGEGVVDGLNRLVLRASLTAEQVDVLRAYRRYRQLIDPRYNGDHLNDVLVDNPDAAANLVSLFEAMFGPAPSATEAEAARAAVLADLDQVARLDHDRILRGLFGTIEATLRANTWPVGAEEAAARPLALKFDSAAVPDMPSPVPFREVFVHHEHVEGIHLRWGPVSRGGLRWSDRTEDYRSEVLDLVRTQVLKNALIVPTGAKGGFVLRGEAASTEGAERAAAVERAYRTYISGLLDVTDDLRGDGVRAVPNRRDGDDPYLVVAADKGTARFSDVANGIALGRGFWLGDAFASGGSNGYDHKALGITARGAWVAVTQHFAELGVDVATEPFTAVGIGDMSGDVFGNGMLRSDRTMLVAAFDHRHVFCDPSPDPSVSYAERRRLYDLPGSSWADYDRSLISAGGGVWPRTAKRVELSEQVRSALRIEEEAVTPPELVRAILRAPVDLLFAGGIGTFVRSTEEDDLTIDDRANAELRIDASTVRARVVGEGANLSFTQRARIEYAKRGGRINMDAIDNSAGVDTSDHEVNLKVLLGLAQDAGEIDFEERNALLDRASDHVVAAVLEDTRRQCVRLTRTVAASARTLDVLAATCQRLEDDGILDRHADLLPSDGDLAARSSAGAGFTRPEAAVVLAGAKRWLKSAIESSTLPDEPATRPALVGYFPPALATRFDHLLDHHRLRRELIASELASRQVDALGVNFAVRVSQDTGASPAEVVAATWVAEQVCGASALWGLLADAPPPPADPGASLLDGEDPALLLADLIESLTRFDLSRRHASGSHPRHAAYDLEERIAADRPVFAALAAALPDAGSKRQRRQCRIRGERIADLGFAAADAVALAVLPELEVVPHVAELSRITGIDPVSLLGAFSELAEGTGIDELRDRLRQFDPGGDPWAAASRQGLLDDLARVRRLAVARAIDDAGGSKGGPPIDMAWAIDAHLLHRSPALEDAERVRIALDADPNAGLDGLEVAVRSLRRALVD